MAVNDASFHQRAVIEFLIKERVLLQTFLIDFMSGDFYMGTSNV
jgi:hypothetical protein